MEQNLHALDFEMVRNQLERFAASGLGRKQIQRMKPLTAYEQIELRQTETSEARRLLDGGAQIPLIGLHDISDLLDRADAGSILETGDLFLAADFIRGCQEIKKYFRQKEETAPLLSGYSRGVHLLSELSDVIEGALDGNIIASTASSRLAKIRDQIRKIETDIQNKLNQLMASSSIRSYLQEPYVSLKNGRYVIPVKAAYRTHVRGMMIDSSGSGATVFIEPESIRKMAEQKISLQRDEEEEVYQIRAWLTAELVAKIVEMRQNLEWMSLFDFIAARARYSLEIQGIPVDLNREQAIHLVQARHPLLGSDAVPLTLHLSYPTRTLLITGPNTGGKTVVLKTVGLFAAMVQCGLHVPAQKGTSLPVFGKIMADIGDEQSIQQSLSTFSGHMKHVSEIIQQADEQSLVLLDEIGTGTDPAEGAALGAAILEELVVKGAITLASTHYGSLKLLAEQHPHFSNGAMTFDPVSLKPLYELKMGESGSSHAFWIANRLGIEEHVIQRATAWLKKPDAETIPFPMATQVQPITSQPAASEPEPHPSEDTEPDRTADIQVGDMVVIKQTGEKARVASVDEENGMLTLVVKGEKRTLGYRRVMPYLSRDVLYPDDYDMKVVLLSKEDRKIDKLLGRKLTDRVRVLDKEGTDEN